MVWNRVEMPGIKSFNAHVQIGIFSLMIGLNMRPLNIYSIGVEFNQCFWFLQILKNNQQLTDLFALHSVILFPYFVTFINIYYLAFYSFLLSLLFETGLSKSCLIIWQDLGNLLLFEFYLFFSGFLAMLFKV